ncbi:DUF86 domain-containing protein [soil metagenome]
MRGKLGDSARIAHIIEAIQEIERYIENVEIGEFEDNSMRRLATIKQLEIVGEAVSHISAELIAHFPTVEWKKIKGLRNILVHEYFGIDTLLIWQIVKEDLPAFKKDVEQVKAFLES